MNKIITILEALVEPKNWELLQQSYSKVDKNDLPSAALNSFLVQDQSTPNLWKIVTIWQSRTDLDKYRKSVEAPAWIIVFRNAQSEPKLQITEIIDSK
ncbi:MAG: hypothetical protein A3J48_01035 [Candidatus Doudnabacteria bacterium RIFCSPHIGHO2_02_FULL_46_11]|uniref:ABM domain-containing protein n=1 Tax=Candidatus Doudnabacteria bacterium RIFCSPHIGHO2_02_FULL_46_11 TaxID=1817832 RepID=A0A1F5P7I7_9BACT|nr:MAG: hypothetical protein A3J48_01035 [Candidatus Doudnabacteria bacterium RIFCSPHIGHO2_02_FULL_46_11]